MPTLTVKTNVARSKIPADILKESTEIFQQAIGKDVKWICVHILPDQLMSFGGSDAPCAVVEVTSIGRLGVEENEKISKIIFEQILSSKLGIDMQRAYVEFRDKPASETGWNATTFHTLTKKK